MENEIILQFTSEVTESIDMNAFVEELMIDISELKTRKVYYLADYLDAQIADTVIDQIQISSILNADLEKIISEVDSITIATNSRFSLLNQMGELPLTNEQLSIIGSGIQAVSMNTNFNGFNFEQNYTFPDWAETGQNVRILKVNQFDFTFFNGFDFEYQIHNFYFS